MVLVGPVSVLACAAERQAHLSNVQRFAPAESPAVFFEEEADLRDLQPARVFSLPHLQAAHAHDQGPISVERGFR